MIIKNEDLQDHNIRLRFKNSSNVQHCDDFVPEKSVKDGKSKGKLMSLNSF